MLSEEIITTSTVSLNELFPNFINQFIKPFENVIDPDIHNGMYLDFELCDRAQKHKVNPILRLARVDDAEELVGIYKELYNGTYPYKEMEDLDEVRKMIRDPSIQWIIYQDPSLNIAGFITFVLDFDNKRGYIRGFMLKKKYQGHVDITKAMIGSMIGMIHKFKDDIYVWYVENRTAHSKSQYSMYVCGIAPIGFYPNKDVFLGKVESDLMQICYDVRVLKNLRATSTPTIISQVEDCYLYSDARYNLGNYEIQVPGIILDHKKISHLKKNIKKSVKKDKFGYETITFTIPESDSFFEFLYTPQVQNFEKSKYHVNNLEELYVFIKEFMKTGKRLGIRYCEAFISAYEPAHQNIFYNAGLAPRGYIPSWIYNKSTGVFEDQILFNWFDGKISESIQLIDEGLELLDVLNLDNIEPVRNVLEEREFLDKFPLFYSFKEKISNVWNYPKTIKISLMTGLMIYLAMLIGSIVVADFFGFNIVSHTISKLGTIYSTPVPMMFDSACVLGGLTTMLLYCYLSMKIRLSTENIKEGWFFLRASRYATIIGVIGSIGIMLVGIFSLDRKGPHGIYHSFSTIIAFGGFAIALLTFGVIIFRRYTKMLKLLGLNGIIPLAMFIFNCLLPSPVLEWILLFSILTTLIPLFCWVSFW
ncbi:MAG: hypothetical protein CEE43_08735 [Promethearchaeota archaeon Loki_b32]|nr:MAG: hypothetical protein CEE43_08735 [Candidatus Lokiarchaeota archaeon Loki_b32]